MDKITFDYEYVDDILALHDQIAECEGRHTQQAIYSTFHGVLTQICFGCKRVRSTVKR